MRCSWSYVTGSWEDVERRARRGKVVPEETIGLLSCRLCDASAKNRLPLSFRAAAASQPLPRSTVNDLRGKAHRWSCNSLFFHLPKAEKHRLKVYNTESDKHLRSQAHLLVFSWVSKKSVFFGLCVFLFLEDVPPLLQKAWPALGIPGRLTVVICIMKWMSWFFLDKWEQRQPTHSVHARPLCCRDHRQSRHAYLFSVHIWPCNQKLY